VLCRNRLLERLRGHPATSEFPRRVGARRILRLKFLGLLLSVRLVRLDWWSPESPPNRKPVFVWQGYLRQVLFTTVLSSLDHQITQTFALVPKEKACSMRCALVIDHVYQQAVENQDHLHQLKLDLLPLFHFAIVPGFSNDEVFSKIFQPCFHPMFPSYSTSVTEVSVSDVIERTGNRR